MRLQTKIMAGLIGSTLLCLPAAAQTPAPLLRVTRAIVKFDHIGEFQDIEKQYTAAYKKAGTWRVVYRTMFGSTNEFVLVSPLDNYGVMDGQSPLVKGGLKEGEIASLASRLAQCVESTRVTIEKSMNDINVRQAGAPPAFIRQIRIRTRQGMADQVLALLKSDITPAIKKAGASGFVVRQVQQGGSRNEITFRTPMGKIGELDGDSMLAKALGPDGLKKFQEKVIALTTNTDYVVMRYLPDLSIPPQ